MTVPTKPSRASDSPGVVRQTAPETKSVSVQAWADATADPSFRAALDAGLKDVKAGRTRPWSEIRRRTR